MSTQGRIWLAGATGFLGGHLSRILLQEGREVTLSSLSGSTAGQQEIESVDILNEESVYESAQGCEAAFLCTGRVSRDADDAGELHRLHVEGTRCALRGLRRAGVRRVVVAGTSGTLAVGMDPDEIFDETSPVPMEFIASWPYYRTKYYGEQAALAENDENFEVIIVSPSMLLGPGDLRESSTGDVRKFLEKSVMATPAGGVAFVDVRDAAQGMLLALEKGRGGERYLLNSANMTVAAFFARLARISGVKAPMIRLPKNHQVARGLFSVYERGLRAMGGVPPVDATSVEMGQFFWYCSSEKAEHELGFVARDPGETLRETLQDLVERQVVARPRSP